MIDRLRAEFNEQDLYLAYRAFDLDAWAGVVSASTPGESGRPLEAALRKIGNALEATTDWNTWRSAARVAISARASASTPDADLVYRLAWRAAMHAAGFPAPMIKVVRFYLATWDGTGAVERGLGADAALQNAHVGQHARNDVDAEVYSALTEMHSDGPQTEPEMFTSTDGVLHLTDFSRACAQQWVLRHGRRFTCYKVRKDKGSRKPQRRKGTDRGVQVLARAAYQTQCDMAKSDAARTSTSGKVPRRQTVLGVDRAKLMVTVRALGRPAAGKKTRKFRAATLAKRAEKQAAETWCGWGSGVPQPRLGGAAAVEAATKSAAMQAVRARLWLSGRARGQAAARKRAEEMRAGTSTSSSSTAKFQAPKASESAQAGAVGTSTWKRRQGTSCPLKAASASTPGSKSPSASMLGSTCSTPGSKSSSAMAKVREAAAAAMAKVREAAAAAMAAVRETSRRRRRGFDARACPPGSSWNASATSTSTRSQVCQCLDAWLQVFHAWIQVLQCLDAWTQVLQVFDAWIQVLQCLDAVSCHGQSCRRKVCEKT